MIRRVMEHENYPTHQPTTKIKFMVLHFVKLIVYDILGEEQARYEKLSAVVMKLIGMQVDLKSLCVFYKLTTNDFSEAKEMLLIK